MIRDPDLSPDELDAETAAELPTREAMSLIATDPSAAIARYGDTSGLLGTPDWGDASGGSVSDADRTLQVSQSQTSTAG
jgi:hypothetical protein